MYTLLGSRKLGNGCLINPHPVNIIVKIRPTKRKAQ